MDLPGELIDDSVEEGNLYFFDEHCDVSVQKHWYVCFKHGDTVLLFSTCSSQLDTAIRLARYRGYSSTTYPVFKANKLNGFTKDTYVDCNKVVEINLVDFKIWLEKGWAKYSGKFDAMDLGKVVRGVMDSSVVERKYKNML